MRPLRPCMCGTTSRTKWAYALRFTASVAFHASANESSSANTDDARLMPALFTKMSMLPNRSSVAATRARRAPSSVTSVGTPRTRALPCTATISVTTRATRSSPRSATMTLAPSSAKRCAVARPIPLAAPVTITVLPATERSSDVRRAIRICLPSRRQEGAGRGRRRRA